MEQANTTQTPAISITEKVKTFEDACQVLGIEPSELMANYPETMKEDAAAILSHTKLLIIVKALNEGWKPDWQNDDQLKFYPWWDMENGFVLYSAVGYYCTGSHVSSRLCFKSRELAQYAADQFHDLYKAYMVY